MSGLSIDFRLEPHLLGEAAGLAFVNGTGQWDIWHWQPLLGGVEVTCLELKMLHSTTTKTNSKKKICKNCTVVVFFLLLAVAITHNLI